MKKLTRLYSFVLMRRNSNTDAYYDRKSRRNCNLALPEREIGKIEEMPMNDLFEAVPLEKAHVAKAVDFIYERCVADSIGTIVDSIDIAGIVEEKIKDMDVETLEELVLSVMKKELDAIVNLGAVIGFVIGIFNTLINML